MRICVQAHFASISVAGSVVISAIGDDVFGCANPPPRFGRLVRESSARIMVGGCGELSGVMSTFPAQELKRGFFSSGRSFK
ncbi:hypothetical protein Xaut_3417 [Xanthobacter versatilis]|uniref:Uncharacterized protein n=1 Tax=Xanthobacter autotrophicus (strain ATCC BAA-1158 / Py2) TaxID=78245 RepID=A7IKV3_XANP2|nr:hypothetical protein Xaut_3417 [Xanthobacter autotrophicus Py2]